MTEVVRSDEGEEHEQAGQGRPHPRCDRVLSAAVFATRHAIVAEATGVIPAGANVVTGGLVTGGLGTGGLGICGFGICGFGIWGVIVGQGLRAAARRQVALRSALILSRRPTEARESGQPETLLCEAGVN